MSSIDAGTPNLVRVGRDPGANAGATRASVAIGFGSPSGDTGVTRLDLNDILVRHPQATFLMRIAGDAMREAASTPAIWCSSTGPSRRRTAMW
jgi:DNA polymerase V